MSSEEKKVDSRKILSKDILEAQIKNAEDFITRAQQEIVKLQSQIQQNVGIAGLAKHYLETFAIAEKAEESKPLEVK